MAFDEWLHNESFHEKIESITCLLGFHNWGKETVDAVDGFGHKNDCSLRTWYRVCRHCKKEQRKIEAIVKSNWS